MRLPRLSWDGSVRIADSDLEDARSLAKGALPKETGGILLGYRRERQVIVLGFLEVPDENSGPSNYNLRHPKAQAALDHVLAVQGPGSIAGYVGEWHSHPGRAGPSRQDVRALRQAARQTDHPVALIVLCVDNGSWVPHAWTARGRVARSARIEVNGDSGSEGGREDES